MHLTLGWLAYLCASIVLASTVRVNSFDSRITFLHDPTPVIVLMLLIPVSLYSVHMYILTCQMSYMWVYKTQVI